MKLKEAAVFTAVAVLSVVPWASASGFDYILDNGSLGSGLGPNSNEASVFVNSFTSQSGFTEIVSVDAFWHTVIGSLSATAGVWSDPNQDGDPNDGVLLGSSALTLGAGEGSFQTFDLLSPIDVGVAGTSFFVGVYWLDDASGRLGLGTDNGTDLDRSWLKDYGAGNPPDPDDLSGSLPRFGNYMIRAHAVPEPASLSLLALGGLAMMRRRRAC